MGWSVIDQGGNITAVTGSVVVSLGEGVTSKVLAAYALQGNLDLTERPSYCAIHLTPPNRRHGAWVRQAFYNFDKEVAAYEEFCLSLETQKMK